MARISWPPSPCVEDEETALAREHGSGTSDSDLDQGKSPSVSRGSIDQLPLIIDVNAKEEPTLDKQKPQKKRPEAVAKPAIRPEPVKSQHPHQASDERRFVHVPAASSSSLGVPTDNARPRSKSTSRIDGDATPRGRPQVHRLQTDFGGDLQAMASGQRRAPSPYAYRPSPTVHQTSKEERSKASMLSPESAAGPKVTEGSYRRSRSARPERHSVAIESSDSDRKPSRHRRHRSKSRRRPSESKHTPAGGEEHFSDKRSTRRDSYHRSRHSPPRVRDPEKSHRSAHGNITPPKTPTLSRESPYVSAAEESDRRRRRDKSRGPERRYSKDSPYTSAAEDTYKRRNVDDQANGVSSRRSSMRRANKPQLDLSEPSQKSRFDPGLSHTSRTPNALEDYFQKAFDDNRIRQSKQSPRYSSHPSPMSSPPTSPPQTPRGERKPRDYFEMNAPPSPAKQRSRPPSTEENSIKPLASIVGAATLGPSLAKTVPNMSRSSTASLETPSTGSQSSTASGQRSRKPSPVYEEPKAASSRPVSRAGSLAGKEDLPSQRVSALSGQYERPVSRAGSTASWEEFTHNHRASTFPMRDERPSSRSGMLSVNGVDHPPMAQRAASYSSYDQPRTRPSSRRTYSTNGSATVMPASSYHPPPGPSHLSHSYIASPSSERAPAPPQPSAPAATEQRTLSFPKCPQPYPVTGYPHWYTIQGMQNFDMCSSCVSVLGKSAFRDYCVPSWKPPTEAITCALSWPWTRIAIARALKDGSANVTLLHNLNTLPSGVLPCPGKQSEIRRWYHITDPTTKTQIGNFDVCAACVRSVELLYPELKEKEKLFERPEGKLSQERTCNLSAGSKHFYAIFNELDRLASYKRKNDLRPKDISAFGIFVRQKTRFRECARDAMLATTLWHYIPALPQFTVCEECFEEVVWPMRNMPIAKDMIMTLQKVPIQRPDHYVAGISCQLYSDRMRAIFKNACSRNDFDGFKQNAIMRYNVEHKLQEKHRILEQESRAGVDRREEMEKNSALWKTYE